MTSIQFGTDGWRGVIADDFTFENVRRVAQATARYWKQQRNRRPATIIGYDNRFMSETYARLVGEVFAANGIKVSYPPEPVPTPAISYAVRRRRLVGAVMITASHNPPQFNGYKVKAHYGGPADPELCRAIEQLVDRSRVRSVPFDDAVAERRIVIEDPRPAHVAAIKKLVSLSRIRNARLRVVIDSMHGCGGRFLEQMIGGQTIRADRNPFFGGVNPEPIGKNLGPLCAAVKKAGAQIGLATDGDADRLGIVDDRGRYVSIQLVFAMLLLHLIRHRKQAAGRVIRSSNCTVLIDRICQVHGLECKEVPVGFKYICAEMLQQDVLIGGEESGGIGFCGHIPERDGILACLMLLEMLAVTGKNVSQLVDELQAEFGRSAYDRIDMHYPLAKRQLLIRALRREPPADLAGSAVTEVKTFDGVKYLAADGAWLMFRTSGTEPIIRIYSEARTAGRVKKLLAWGRQRALQIGT